VADLLEQLIGRWYSRISCRFNPVVNRFLNGIGYHLAPGAGSSVQAGRRVDREQALEYHELVTEWVNVILQFTGRSHRLLHTVAAQDDLKADLIEKWAEPSQPEQPPFHLLAVRTDSEVPVGALE
jgi:hypothetical protein